MGFLKNNLEAYWAYRKLNKIKMQHSDSLIIVATAGIGDICYALAYLKDLKEKERKKVLAISSPYAQELLSFYPDIDETYVLSDFETKCFKLLGNSRFGSLAFNNKEHRNSVYTCDAWRFLPWRVMRLPNITFLDTIKFVNYELEEDACVQYPVVMDCDLSSFRIQDWSRVVVINPHSNYLNTESSLFDDIAQRLLAKNFDVYTNVSSQFTKSIEGTKPLKCNLQQLYSIVSKAKCFVSVRSGIVDFTVNSGGNFLVIYDYESLELFGKIYQLKDWNAKSKIVELNSRQREKILHYIEKI